MSATAVLVIRCAAVAFWESPPPPSPPVGLAPTSPPSPPAMPPPVPPRIPPGLLDGGLISVFDAEVNLDDALPWLAMLNAAAMIGVGTLLLVLAGLFLCGLVGGLCQQRKKAAPPTPSRCSSSSPPGSACVSSGSPIVDPPAVASATELQTLPHAFLQAAKLATQRRQQSISVALPLSQLSSSQPPSSQLPSSQPPSQSTYIPLLPAPPAAPLPSPRLSRQLSDLASSSDSTSDGLRVHFAPPHSCTARREGERVGSHDSSLDSLGGSSRRTRDDESLDGILMADTDLGGSNKPQGMPLRRVEPPSGGSSCGCISRGCSSPPRILSANRAGRRAQAAFTPPPLAAPACSHAPSCAQPVPRPARSDAHVPLHSLPKHASRIPHLPASSPRHSLPTASSISRMNGSSGHSPGRNSVPSPVRNGGPSPSARTGAHSPSRNGGISPRLHACGTSGGIGRSCGAASEGASPSTPRAIGTSPTKCRSVRASSELTSWAANCGAQHTQQQRLTLPASEAGEALLWQSPPERSALTAAHLASISESVSSHHTDRSSTTNCSAGSATARKHAYLLHEEEEGPNRQRMSNGPSKQSWRDEVGGYPLL